MHIKEKSAGNTSFVSGIKGAGRKVLLLKCLIKSGVLNVNFVALHVVLNGWNFLFFNQRDGFTFFLKIHLMAGRKGNYGTRAAITSTIVSLNVL